MQSKSIRWYGVITLFLIVAISYVDRINIAVLIVDHDFLKHIGIAPGDRVRQGLLATSFTLGYGISAFALTPFCETLFGVRRSLTFGLSLRGVVTFITPWFEGYALLLVSRVLLGVTEGPVFSLASSYTKAYFAGSLPMQRRGVREPPKILVRTTATKVLRFASISMWASPLLRATPASRA